MKHTIKYLFIIGLNIATYGQVVISGNITDQDKEPLIGVEIYVPELHIGTTSNLDGNYTLNNLPHGNIEIQFSFYGFEPVSKKIDIHRDFIELNIELKPSIFKIEEVIISTAFNRLQSENVMKVELATVLEIKQKGAATLVEGLETIPGVSQISTGTSIGKPVIRGLSGNRVLVYTQGIRLENQQYGDEHGLGLNQAGIESVEVIKGPASLLYGSDALGGVLYFNPERFASKNTFTSDFNTQYYSNTQGNNTSIGLKQSSEQWKYLVRGAYNTHIDYKTPSNGRVSNSRFNEMNLNTGIGFHNKLISSEFRYNYNQANTGLTEGIGEQSTSRKVQEPYQLINNHILSLHNHIYFDTSKLDIDFGYSHNDRNEYEEAHELESLTEENPALRMKLNTFQYDLKYHFNKVKSKEFILGIQGMNQTNTNFGEELLIPNAHIQNIGLFGTTTIDFKNSSLLAGLRFDTRNIDTEYHEIMHDDETHVFEAIDKQYHSFTGSLGLKFDLLENLTTRINIASGFRAPNLAELTSNGVHHGTNRFEKGNSDLQNEQNVQLDIALEYQNDHFEFFVNGFYNGLNDYIYLNPTGEIEDDAAVYTYIQNDAHLYGGEFGFHLHPHPLDWLHLESSFETVTGKQRSGAYLPLIPANSWKNTVRSEFDMGEWLQSAYATFSINSYFKQDNISAFETSSDGYTLVNLGLGGEINLFNTKFEVMANLNNAFNQNYIAHLSRLKTFNIPNMGRNFVVNLSFNI